MAELLKNVMGFLPVATDPNGKPDHALASARIFCPDKVWGSCQFKDICVDGSEHVWVPCPTVKGIDSEIQMDNMGIAHKLH